MCRRSLMGSFWVYMTYWGCVAPGWRHSISRTSELCSLTPHKLMAMWGDIYCRWQMLAFWYGVVTSAHANRRKTTARYGKGKHDKLWACMKAQQIIIHIWPCDMAIECVGWKSNAYPLKKLHQSRVDSRLAPSQWEMSLQSNAVSHWLGTNLESTLQ